MRNTSINDSLPILASWYADKFGVPVVLDASAKTEHTDGKKVTVPLIDFAELGRTESKETVELTKNAVIGWLAHGCMHVRSTDFDVAFKSQLSSKEFSWLNILEDARIEREAVTIWPGTLETLSSLSKYLVEKGLYITDPKSVEFDSLLFQYTIYKAHSEVAEHDCLNDLAKKFRHEVVGQVGENFTSQYDNLVLETKHTTSTEEVCKLVKRIFKFFKDELGQEDPFDDESMPFEHQEENSQPGQNGEQSQEQAQNDGQKDSEEEGDSSNQAQGQDENVDNKQGNESSNQNNNQCENQQQDQNGSDESESDDSQGNSSVNTKEQAQDQTQSQESSQGENQEGNQDDANNQEQNSQDGNQGDSSESSQGNNQSQGEERNDDGESQNQNSSSQESDGQDNSQVQEKDNQQDNGKNQNQDDGQSQEQSVAQAKAPQGNQNQGSKSDKLKSLFDGKALEVKDAFEELGKEFGELIEKTNSHSSPLSFPLKGEVIQKGYLASNLLPEVKAESNNLSRKLRALVEARQRVNSRLTRTGRNIDVAKLHRTSVGNYKVFRKEDDKVMPNTAVSVLLDASSSMYKEMLEAQKACASIALALSPIKGVKTSVKVFKGGNENTTILDLLDFEENANHEIARFFNFKAEGGTPLTEGLWSCGVNLLKRKEDKKIIFVVTDGEPNNAISAKEIISQLEKEGVVLIGIGMGGGAVNIHRFFKNHVFIRNVKELNNTLFSVIQNILLN